MSAELRFWSHVEKTDTCWLWKGAKINNHGHGYYGAFYIKSDKVITAHRFSYEACVTSIPQGMLVCHKCDNGLCVNPSHLFLGTHQDNIRDRHSKGRDARGEKLHLHKLTEQQVREIRIAISSGETETAISKQYGVSQVAISCIALGKTWGWLK